MKKYVIAALLGLHPVVGGAYCSSIVTTEGCEAEQQARRDGIEAEVQRHKDEYEQSYQRSRPVQVIEPGGVRTYYPDSSGSSWVTYDPKPGSR